MRSQPAPHSLFSLADSAVDPALDREIRALLVACFPDDPIFATQRHFRRIPAHRILVRSSEGALIGQLAVHDLTIGTELGELRAAGIAEVAVASLARGRGIAKQMLEAAHVWAVGEGIEHALLFGAAEVYGSSGYVALPNPVRMLDSATNGPKTEISEFAMHKPLKAGSLLPAGVFDLRGPSF